MKSIGVLSAFVTLLILYLPTLRSGLALSSDDKGGYSLSETIGSIRNKTSEGGNKRNKDPTNSRTLDGNGVSVFVRRRNRNTTKTTVPVTVLLPPDVGKRSTATPTILNFPSEDAHASHDHAHEDRRSGDDSNATYDYTPIHKEWNTTEDDGWTFVRHSGDRVDICAMCLCTMDLTKVSCEHIDHENKHYKLKLDSSLIPNETRYIQIRGYDEVTVEPFTFSSETTNISAILFEDIGQLILKRDSFNIAENAGMNVEMTLQFVNCNISSFPTDVITQKLRGEHGRHSRVNIRDKRFLSIVIHRCRIGIIGDHAFTRARLIYLNVSNTKINEIGYRGLDLDVYELSLFKNNRFPPLKQEALCLHAKKVVFTENHFEDIGNRSIVIETDSQVLFEFNQVKMLREEALRGIHPINMYGSNIVFHRNTVFEAEQRSLVIDPLFPIHERKVFNNTFKILCNCTIDEYFRSIVGMGPHDPDLGDSFMILLRRTKCIRPYTWEEVSVYAFLEKDCAPFPIVVVVSVSVAFVLFIIAMIVCIACSLRMQHLRDEAKSLGECTSQSFSTLNRQWTQMELEMPPQCNSNPMSPIWIQTAGTAFPFAVAVPEVKTYQQNEVNDFTEWTESIRGSAATSLDLLGRKDLKVITRASCPLN